jgi:hypothetical protein
MSALGKMTRIIDIAVHTPAIRRLDLGRRRSLGRVLNKILPPAKLIISNAWKNVRKTRKTLLTPGMARIFSIEARQSPLFSF